MRDRADLMCDLLQYSLGPEKILGNILLGNLSTLGEVATSARSGSFFLKSTDGAYMIKTLPPAEEQTLLRILPSYYVRVARERERERGRAEAREGIEREP